MSRYKSNRLIRKPGESVDGVREDETVWWDKVDWDTEDFIYGEKEFSVNNIKLKHMLLTPQEKERFDRLTTPCR